MLPKRAKAADTRRNEASGTCHVCSIFTLPIKEQTDKEDGDEALLCEEACKCWFHRWCGGVTGSRYQALSNSSQPFFCPACTAATQKQAISDLQDVVKAHADEVRGLKATIAAIQNSNNNVKPSRPDCSVWTTVPARKPGGIVSDTGSKPGHPIPGHSTSGTGSSPTSDRD